ncbi:MAG: hypothetical protein LBI33_12915 [Propionibacteriaceae bacterium]|jgi:hypothetical protein|nr:hypothetical protein [Propionibacteriaceae bacterium]
MPTVRNPATGQTKPVANPVIWEAIGWTVVPAEPGGTDPAEAVEVMDAAGPEDTAVEKPRRRKAG